MRLSKLLLASGLVSFVCGAAVQVDQQANPLAVRATSSSKSSSSTKTTSSSKGTTSATSVSSTKSSSTSSSSTKVADAACTNGPFTRSCWSNGFSIATDFDTKHPTTGRTVTYDFTITNTTMQPDGTKRLGLLVNGQYPGPTLIANWGDMIVVNVHNQLQDNGTGIHWHGLRQFNTNTEDGVPGVTECPLAPGDSRTYTFQATQFGTSWYHSHFSAQYGDGIMGAIMINGPATANYDIDLGTYTIQDYYYSSAYSISEFLTRNLVPPPAADNGLINGSMVNPVSGGGGKYTTNTLTAGKKYRLRLINTSLDNHFMVSLDNHPFTVITSDFVPIKPYTANWIFMGIGQRYDVIITANQNVSSYWFRAEVQSACGANNNNGNIKSIFTYAGAASTTPASSATTYTSRCTDETGLVPFWNSFVPSGPLANQTTELDVAIQVGADVNGQVVSWGVNFTALNVDWDKPIRQYVLDGNNSFPKSENLISLPTAGQWYYWIIQEVAGQQATINIPHPIHLHGHDFYVLGTGDGQYSQTNDGPNLQYTNPPRRDVAMLNAGGWLALAFQTDNPGAWLMHCHIAWHAGQGLAVQFLETEPQIEAVNPSGAAFQTTCKNWNAWYPAKAYYLKEDSGI
ncbi:hypothetical protein BP6252_12223 [Coleophoma cylindrospora]|uniref:laccase n=1 Tax=Coleophoma cylindrospora TaxID=1849047 RepID=A0A3D8QGN8_9HELO|nr:hypothetical protein BP6252_12223 [Coleophoma cylindrospora]